jgi:hypothetical protein
VRLARRLAAFECSLRWRRTLGVPLKVNRFVVDDCPRPEYGRARADPAVVRVSLKLKESSMDHADFATNPPVNPTISARSRTDCDDRTMTAPTVRRLASPVRLTLASQLGADLDGAWWPHTASVARELPGLIDALRAPLGEVVDIGINWSSLEGAPDLDSLNRHGFAAQIGLPTRRQRVMTITGTNARAHLLVVPSRTTRALAVMVMRHAAALPILAEHYDTQAFRTADDIVRAARAECAQVKA